MGTPSRDLRTVVRSRVAYLALRALTHERRATLARRGLLRPLEWYLAHGELQMLGGMTARTRIAGWSLSPSGAQSWGILTGSHELQVQEALRRSVGAGDVVWDVGANIGATSLVAAHIVGPTGRVVAVEPNPACARACTENARLNGVDWLDVRAVAATAAAGDVELIVVSDDLWSRLAVVGEHPLEAGRITVPGVPLDDLDAPRPALVKIDVEGGELEVLAGMTRLLSTVRPRIVCEMHGKNAAFVATMTQANYRVVNLDGPEPVDAADGNVHALCIPLSTPR